MYFLIGSFVHSLAFSDNHLQLRVMAIDILERFALSFLPSIINMSHSRFLLSVVTFHMQAVQHFVPLRLFIYSGL